MKPRGWICFKIDHMIYYTKQWAIRELMLLYVDESIETEIFIMKPKCMSL